MATTTTIRPSSVASDSGYTATRAGAGSAPNVTSAVSDISDATYIRKPNSPGGYTIRWALADPASTPAAGSFVWHVDTRFRFCQGSTGSLTAYITNSSGVGSGTSVTGSYGTIISSSTASVTRAAGVSLATVTTTSAHGFTTGDTVVMENSGTTNLDGLYSITVTSSTQFTYTSGGTTAVTGAAVSVFKAADLTLQAFYKAPSALGGGVWTQSMLNTAQFMLVDTTSSTTGNRARIFDVQLDIITSTLPSVSGVTVTGTTTSSKPSLSWTYSQADSIACTGTEIYIYPSSISSPTPGVTAGWAYYSGVLGGSVRDHTTTSDLVNGTAYTAYVQSYLAVDGTSARDVGSGWVSSAFTMAITPPATPSITSVDYAASTQAATVTVANRQYTSGTVATTTDLQRSDDGGSTWTYVRGAQSQTIADPAEALLSQAVFWIDAGKAGTSGQTVTNLGTGGATLNATVGSTGSADSNDPKWLDWSGANYVYFPGANGNYFTTPSSTAFNVTDLDVRAQVTLDDWTPATTTVFVRRDDGDPNRQFIFRLNTSGLLELSWCPTGSFASNIVQSSSVATGVADGTTKWVRVTLDVDNGASAYEVKFWLSDDGTTWTQLGVTRTGAAVTTLPAVTAFVYVSYDGSALAGKVHRVQLLNGIGGTAVLNIDTSLITDGAATSFTATTGQTITINRATSGRKTAVVTRPMWLFGTDDYMSVADNDLLDFSATQSFTVVAAVRAWNTLANRIITKRGASGGAWDWYFTSPNTDGYVSDGTNSVFGTGFTTAFTAGSLNVGAFQVDRGTQIARTIVNGTASAGRSIASIGSLANTFAMQIGGWTTGGAYTDMELLGAAVFRRALTTEELAIINAYYQAAATRSVIADYEVPRDRRNLISNPTFDLGTSGWSAVGNTAIAQTTSPVQSGAGALLMRSTAAGTIYASTSGIAVTPSSTYTASAYFRAATTGRSSRVDIDWYTAGGAFISTTSGTAATSTTTGWTRVSGTHTAPANAATATPVLVVLSTAAAAEVHYADSVQLESGSTLNAFDGVGVRYRARSAGTVGGNTVVSSWATAQAVSTPNDGAWWLKDVTYPANNLGAIRVQPAPSFTREEPTAVHRPFGRTYPVVVHGDLGGRDGDLEIIVSSSQWIAFQTLLNSQRTLLLQDPFDDQRYMRITSRGWAVEGAASDPRYRVTVSFVEVESGLTAG